jgi:hypothetical protein
MSMLMKVAVGLVALFGLVLGLGFLVQPDVAAARFFVTANGVPGLASIRADVAGFFLVAGVFAAHAVLRGVRSSLLPPLALYGAALFGRTVNLLQHGANSETFPPMVVELVLVMVLAAAWRSAGRTA